MNPRKSFLVFLALASQMLLSLTAPAGAQQFKVGTIVVDQPWTRATPGGSDVAVGYLTITNSGSEPDRFVGVSSPGAARTEIHEMKMEGGVMKMRPVAPGIALPPGEKVDLKAGGYHLMFVKLNGPLKEGETLKARLQFEKAGALDVTFKVEGKGAQGPHEGMHMN